MLYLQHQLREEAVTKGRCDGTREKLGLWITGTRTGDAVAGVLPIKGLALRKTVKDNQLYSQGKQTREARRQCA
jgi:hypothetical protein